MSDDKVVEAAEEAFCLSLNPGKPMPASAIRRQAIRAALAAADKVRAERLQDDCGDEIGKIRMALAEGEAERAALVEALADIASQPITGEDASTKHTRSYDGIVKLARAALALVRKGV